jgi:peptidoglycan-associated lipoprotein
MLQRLLLLLLLLALPLGACSRRQQPVAEGPRPTLPDTAGEGARRAAELERARQDSIARARAAEEDARRREGGARARAVLEERVHFDYDESTLRADAQEALGRKVAVLRANPQARIRIAGHADERGSVEYNLALGMRRAQSVRDYLAGFGIDVARMDITSMGEDQPLDPASTETAWALNRRAEFTVTAGGDNLVMPGT